MGEIAFQLDRRILNYVFNDGGSVTSMDRKRFYGYLIQNIPSKIIRECLDRNTGVVDQARKAELNGRYYAIMNKLSGYGYNVAIHSDLSVDLVNKYGLLPLPSNRGSGDGVGAEAKGMIVGIVKNICPNKELPDVLIMLDCLAHLAEEDGKAMLMF